MIEAHPGFINEFRDDLQAAAARDVVIAGVVLDETSLIEGTKLVVSHHAERLLPGQRSTWRWSSTDGGYFSH